MDKRSLRILVVGAHPDDCEFSMGGTAVKFKRLGHTVKFVYATNGDAGHHLMNEKELAERRAEEVRNGCEKYGLEYEIMDNHDGLLEPSVAERVKLIGIIRSFRPDFIFTHRINDYHPDHRNTAQLVQDSSYLVIVPNICREVPPLDYAPVIMNLCDFFQKPNEFKPDIAVAIDDVLAEKTEMLHCHRSQVYEWLPWTDGKLAQVPETEKDKIVMLRNWITARDSRKADKFRDLLIERYGEEAGNRIICAEAFEMSEYGGKLDRKSLWEYFPI